MPTNLNDYYPPSEVGTLLAPAEPIKIEVGDRDFRGTVSEFVERYMTIDGKPFSFARRKYLRPIYDDSFPFAKRTILRCARQCEKSSTLGMKSLAYVTVIPWFKVLYVSPSQVQTRQGTESAVKQLQTQTDAAKKAVAAFKQPLDSAKSQREKVNSDISTVTSLLPGIVTVSSITYGSQSLTITGTAPDDTTIVDYVRALRNSNQF